MPYSNQFFFTHLYTLQVMILGAYSMLETGMGSACLDALEAQANKQRPHFAPRKWEFVRQSLNKLRLRC